MEKYLESGTAISTAAYSNNYKGAATTTLYHITAGGELRTQHASRQGESAPVGPLGIENIHRDNGFDISGADNKAYAILTTGALTRLYRINLQTGGAASLGDFPVPVKGLALKLDL